MANNARKDFFHYDLFLVHLFRQNNFCSCAPYTNYFIWPDEQDFIVSAEHIAFFASVTASQKEIHAPIT